MHIVFSSSKSNAFLNIFKSNIVALINIILSIAFESIQRLNNHDTSNGVNVIPSFAYCVINQFLSLFLSVKNCSIFVIKFVNEFKSSLICSISSSVLNNPDNSDFFLLLELKSIISFNSSFLLINKLQISFIHLTFLSNELSSQYGPAFNSTIFLMSSPSSKSYLLFNSSSHKSILAHSDSISSNK